ncbi:MAG: hypothetical protein AAGJ81_14820 [Verrucomicrobiota bacterium]
MSYNFYTFFHLLGLILLSLGLGALLARAVLAPENKSFRIGGAIVAGFGMIFLLVAGFGMQAKGGYGWPLWLNLKVVIWLLLGAVFTTIKRKPEWNVMLWVSVIVLTGLAAWLGVFGKLTPALQ